MTTKHANADEFHNELGENPLGDLVESKAVGPFVIELYENPIGSHRRRREDEPVQAVVSVWRKADPDHWRGYEDLETAWFGEEEAIAKYNGLQSAEGVRSFLETVDE